MDEDDVPLAILITMKWKEFRQQRIPS